MPRDALYLYAPTPAGLGPTLADELKELGVEGGRAGQAGVSWRGSLEQAYRVLLWSRLASRVLLQLGRFPAADGDSLYAGAMEIDWTAVAHPDLTLAVRTSAMGAAINHTGFAARRIKDAVVDTLREAHGRRPNVDLRQPDLQLHLHLQGERATVSVDLAGESLHRRGYRAASARAPLKENLAAALLRLLGWPAIAAKGGAFVDPMCGSGTLPIEAAWMAGDRAPGLGRERWGFSGWAGHEPALWAALVDEAEQRAEAGLERLPPVVGHDGDRGAVAAAIAAARQAGLEGKVHLERRELGRCEPPARSEGRPGLVAVNPPYGERLGTASQLGPLYAGLGARLAQAFDGWRAGVLTTPELVPTLGINPGRTTPLRNGALQCELVSWRVGAARAAASGGERAPRMGQARPGARDQVPGADAFAARLRKRAKHLDRWARRRGISCYRVYDADLSDYNLAVDRYGDRVQVQEYAPPAHVDPELAARRLAAAMAATPDVLGVKPAHVILKTRRRQGRGEQYERMGQEGDFFEVREGPCAFLVNLTDYLDTGLYLDHRPVRALMGERAGGKRVLNLFGYTGTATVHAALGGAVSSVTVDRSNTYIGWARRNFTLNGMDPERHRLVKADVLPWLRDQGATWDLIYVDPPTFSNSTDAEQDFDVQRDHVALLDACVNRLSPDGLLIFSTHSRRFKLDRAALEGRGLAVEDRSRQTVPEDFQRKPRVHQVFLVRREGKNGRNTPQ